MTTKEGLRTKRQIPQLGIRGRDEGRPVGLGGADQESFAVLERDLENSLAV